MPATAEDITSAKIAEAPNKMTKNSECTNWHKVSKSDQDKTAMGSGDGKLNSKYNPDCFSDSELDSESDEDEQYRYEHGYKTLI